MLLKHIAAMAYIRMLVAMANLNRPQARNRY